MHVNVVLYSVHKNVPLEFQKLNSLVVFTQLMEFIQIPRNWKISSTSVKELQQFLGMVQHMSSFIANLSEKTGPLRELTEKDSSWMWTATHETTFTDQSRRRSVML